MPCCKSSLKSVWLLEFRNGSSKRIQMWLGNTIHPYIIISWAEIIVCTFHDRHVTCMKRRVSFIYFQRLVMLKPLKYACAPRGVFGSHGLVAPHKSTYCCHCSTATQYPTHSSGHNRVCRAQTLPVVHFNNFNPATPPTHTLNFHRISWPLLGTHAQSTWIAFGNCIIL